MLMQKIDKNKIIDFIKKSVESFSDCTSNDFGVIKGSNKEWTVTVLNDRITYNSPSKRKISFKYNDITALEQIVKLVELEPSNGK